MITLKDAAAYVRSSRPTKLILAILRKATRIFNFKEERDNRVSRYVAIINEYKRGTPLAQIETKYGCTRTTIHTYIRNANISPRSFKPQHVKDAVLKDYKLGLPISKISELHNVSPKYIHDVARKAGLRRNTGDTRRKSHIPRRDKTA